MRNGVRMMGVWSAVAFFLTWLIGFALIARWVPPLPPSATAEQVARIFESRSVPIRIGMICMGVGAVLYLPWSVLLADIVKRIEGRSFFLSGTELAAGILSTTTFFIPSFAWATAAFRAGRDPQVVQALVDFGWLFFITAIGPFILQYVVLAVAIFLDKRDPPAYPRWVAYMQLWVSLLFCPAVIAYFMKRGPFAWNGLLVWWIPFAAFTFWFVAMIVLTRSAVRMAPVDGDADQRQDGRMTATR